MKLNLFIHRLLLSTLLYMVVFVATAQPGDPGGDPDVPIAGIEVLIALGGFLGLRRFISSRQRRS
jgi:hypothetical protein